jgi:hypothetical protein
MKAGLRRLILLLVIVVTGSVMILSDIPLIIMIPFIIIVGLILLLLLGAITPADIRSLFKKGIALQKTPESKTGAKTEKKSFIQRLDEIKFFEKPSPKSAPAAPLPPTKKSVPGVVEKKPGISGHLSSIVTSLSSLGSILKERGRHVKKVEDINKLLDKTVSEKVKMSALADAGKIGSVGGGAAPALSGGAKEEDLFLSLSGEEFDTGLLDELDDQEKPAMAPGGAEALPASIGGSSPTSLAESELSMPALDITSDTSEILKENMPGLEEFSGLEGDESIDQEFSDLENLSIDDVNLDEEFPEDKKDDTEKSSDEPLKEIPEPSSPSEKPGVVKTEWISSDAPGGGTDQISTQADMVVFAGGSQGTDEDLLSSIASDVKTVKKETDISLVRELKDFKAPATDIEKELTDMYGRLQAMPKNGQRKPQADKE